MRYLILDIETTFQRDDRGRCNPSPFHPDNKLVSVGAKTKDTDILYWGIEHKEMQHHYASDEIQELLDNTDVLVGHNIKFDLQWLLECGYTYEGEIWDTMLYEYLKYQGINKKLDLSSCCTRYGINVKKEMEWGAVPTDEIEWAVLREYGINDVRITEELYLKQTAEEVVDKRILDSTFLFCRILTDMEWAGIAINVEELDKLEEEYTVRLGILEQEMNSLVAKVMGDTPISLSSPTDVSVLLYSRRVKDRKRWTSSFGIGVGASKWDRVNNLKSISKATFYRMVKSLTTIEYRTKATPCTICSSTGKVPRRRSDGTLMPKATSKCTICNGTGVDYKYPKMIPAGFRLTPLVTEVTANGFSTSRDTIERLLVDATGDAREFLIRLEEYNAITTYLSSFIQGIRRGVGTDGILHPQFMQAVTSTGRLSSRNPNFQNQPRGSTFPIRRCVTSRFKGGKILEADFAQLEFRVAVELSGDEQGKEDIRLGVDKHMFTANIIGCSRQDAKAHTFKPLYGGTSGTKKERSYYTAFAERHGGITRWHTDLCEEAINTGRTILPTGRYYLHPNTKRTWNGGATGATKIKNYPVQGLATADIVPVVVIEVNKALTNYKSCVINTVHDSVVVDVHKDELDIVPRIVYDVTSNAKDIIKKYFRVEFTVPLEIEVKIGDNWLDTEVIEWSN